MSNIINFEAKEVKCSFCQRPEKDVFKMFDDGRGDKKICSICIKKCAELLKPEADT